MKEMLKPSVKVVSMRRLFSRPSTSSNEVLTLVSTFLITWGPAGGVLALGPDAAAGTTFVEDISLTLGTFAIRSLASATT